MGPSKSPFPNVLDSDLEHVQKAVRNAGLELAALHFSGKIDIESDEGIEPTVVALKDYASYALALGCKYLTHPVPTCGCSRVPTAEKAIEIRRLATCMNRVAEAFMERGLQIGADIHYRAWVEGLDDCRLLFDSMPCPNAGIILNIGHMTTAQSYGWLLTNIRGAFLWLAGKIIVSPKIVLNRCYRLNWALDIARLNSISRHSNASRQRVFT